MSQTREPTLGNLGFVEQLYAQFVEDPQSVSPDWQEYFTQLNTTEKSNGSPQLGPSFRARSVFAGGTSPGAATTSATNAPAAAPTGRAAQLQDRVFQMVRAYRDRGHLIAKIDPLEIPRPPLPELFPAFYGFTDADMDLEFPMGTVHAGRALTLREIIGHLRRTYCGSIGVQFMHIDDLVTKFWLEERMELTENSITLSPENQRIILTKLTDAVIFEEFIQKKFRGAKSFSLEGCESLIPLLHQSIERAGDDGIQELVIAMAHRGRLNVMANIMGKGAKHIFQEFFDKNADLLVGRGDVKYHLGYSSDWTTRKGKEIHLSLCFNPSHLEYVNPVALGRVRSKQDRIQDTKRELAMSILIHGDAAFAGEGVVQETLNISALKAYRTGGALHIIMNNQIGFTTAPSESRSCIYATDVARMLQCPIFHVNGEDPEAVAQVVRLAMDYRAEYKQDVVIDMYGYRRHGHNEGDEPAFTQPILYKAIRARKSVREGYVDHLSKIGDITREDAKEIEDQRHERLEEAFKQADSHTRTELVENSMMGIWTGYVGGKDVDTPEVDTGVPTERLSTLMDSCATLPETFTPHPKIAKILKQRLEMGQGKRPLDWGAAEILAFASLAVEGAPVRLSGQDCERGTFSHRHSVNHDFETGQKYYALRDLTPDQAPVEIHNSSLSEAAVLGFEYGYSLDMPEGLVMWEAQFGDFSNCAQVIIDQFISSAEDKWERLSGIVMLLPHAMEGMGPEHSSARLERFLAMAAEDNIQIAYPSTPAQHFHLLRRQVKRPLRKPLIVMTPKSLLRHPRATSTLEELSFGSFQRILPDPLTSRTKDIDRIIWCSGKVYFELEELREKHDRDNVAILRLEQLYPLSDATIAEALTPYPEGTEILWVQDEPENMGAWRHLRARFGRKVLDKYPFTGVSRPESASPATGSKASHVLEQAIINKTALRIED